MRQSEKLLNEYINREDWRVKENSNNDYSYASLRSHIASNIVADYMLHNVYTEEIGQAHRNADIHVHDLSHGIAVYCCGWSLRDLLMEGFGEIKGRANSKPPTKLRTACLQMANFLGTLQSEASGAQAFNSVDTFLAPYIKIKNIPYEEVKQCLQELVYNLNIPTRSGEIPFTNFSFDWVCPSDLAIQHPMIGGEPVSFTYADCQVEMGMINKAFIEILTEGDCNGRTFGFPIPTYSITKDFDFTTENAKLLFNLTAQYGSPYFQNFINSELNPGDIRSMCCRLSLDLKQLKRRGGMFNAWDGTGSIGVVTINMARLGYLSVSKEDFYQRLDNLLELAKQSLVLKRGIINKLYERGLFPYCSRWLRRGFKNHFNTIGVIGFNECVLNFLKDELIFKDSKDFVLEVMDHLLAKIGEFQEETGELFNLEETPGEGACYRFAKEDVKRFKDIVTSGTDKAPYYTQGAKLPFGLTENIFEILDHQQEISVKYTGGSVQHVFLGEKIPGDMAAKLVQLILTNYKTPYITLSPTFSICPNHGYIQGEVYQCPKCNHDTEVYSRIVGYYSPLHRWNRGKVEEFSDRKVYEQSIKRIQ